VRVHTTRQDDARNADHPRYCHAPKCQGRSTAQHSFGSSALSGFPLHVAGASADHRVGVVAAIAVNAEGHNVILCESAVRTQLIEILKENIASSVVAFVRWWQIAGRVGWRIIATVVLLWDVSWQWRDVDLWVLTGRDIYAELC